MLIKSINFSIFSVAIAIPLVPYILINTLWINGFNSPWYQQLKKAHFSLPAWFIQVTWILADLLMGVASAIVYIEGKAAGAPLTTPLIWYTVQLVVNLSWDPIFFGWRKTLFSTVHSYVLWKLISATVKSFEKVSMMAALLMIPYLVWVTYMSSLILSIWWDN
ncbi:Translocator protein [Halotydeus destructor]|nr:Translocator protein [Halotydeus destructor]